MKLQELIDSLYISTREIERGKVADYIPQLAKVDPNKYGISIYDIKGQGYSVGDTDEQFCLQSCSKPLNYCLARLLNPDVHSHVGYEPSGRKFNSHVLNPDGLPHNPMINAGAIMVSSLIGADLEPSKRFELVKEFYQELSGGKSDNQDNKEDTKVGKTYGGTIGFDNTVFLSERHHADRNMSLAYYMRESGAFKGEPSPNDIQNCLDLYFQCCSVTINTDIGAIMAATLANGGVCPVSNKRVIDKAIVRECLSLMYQCGMYDFSGQFAFKIGLPAKSGVSGCLLLVIPNVAGICIWSPPLDDMGNPVRGIEFCKKFVEKTHYKYHIFHSVTHSEEQALIPEEDASKVQKLISAAAQGDLERIKELDLQGVNLESSDYDGRTPLHLAAVNGHVEVVRYLVEYGVDKEVKDRWNNTPYDEANKIRTGFIEAEQKISYNEICCVLEQ